MPASSQTPQHRPSLNLLPSVFPIYFSPSRLSPSRSAVLRSCLLIVGFLLGLISTAADAQSQRPSFDNIPPANLISAGDKNSCAIRDNATVVCWGSNDKNRSNPLSNSQITADTRFQQVAAGATHACGLTLDQTVLCWGEDANGRTKPPSDQFTTISINYEGAHACGIRIDKTIKCWGDDGGAQRRVTGAPTGEFIAVAAGIAHNCAIRTNGKIECWGSNNNNRRDGKPSGTFMAISAGGHHSCAIKTGGTASCWGNSDSGRTTPPNPNSSFKAITPQTHPCLLYTSPSPRDRQKSRMPSSA